jgi:hypothetical protein
MQEIVGTTPGQQGERRLRVRYERRERDERPRLYLSVMVADSEVAEIRTTIRELFTAVLGEAGLE